MNFSTELGLGKHLLFYSLGFLVCCDLIHWFKCHVPFLCVLPEYLEVVWRSLASEDAECPLLVKNASDTLAELLKDPKTYDNITKDFKYGGHTSHLHSLFSFKFGMKVTERLRVLLP